MATNNATASRTISTTPFSGVTTAQVTRALIARARSVAASRGDTQFGFRAAKDQPYHTMGYTDPQRGPAIGDSSELTDWDLEQGDWIVRDGRWLPIRA